MTAGGVIYDALCALGLSGPGSLELLRSSVRDRDDVCVMRDRRSGVIFLSRSDHVDAAHYAAQQDFGYWSVPARKQALAECADDDRRRAETFRGDIAGRRWLDIGTGAGGILELLAPLATSACAVEPQDAVRAELAKSGWEVYPDIESVSGSDFEVVTLFHVFEHMTAPLDALKLLRSRMARGGRLIVEVPHANDFLISFLNLEAFQKFTFWSEHLILHNRASLAAFLGAAGFENIAIQGCQRYPLANHLHWCAKQKPGGHRAWSQLKSPQLDSAYASLLASLDMTDTLVAYANS